MKWFISRMTEPSSHGGIAGFLAAIAPFVPPQYQALIAAGGALFGAIAVLVKEKGSQQ